MDCGVFRDELLTSLSEIMNNPDVVNWGMQCNRAVRQGYPHVHIKRKGKFKKYPLLQNIWERGGEQTNAR